MRNASELGHSRIGRHPALVVGLVRREQVHCGKPARKEPRSATGPNDEPPLTHQAGRRLVPFADSQIENSATVIVGAESVSGGSGVRQRGAALPALGRPVLSRQPAASSGTDSWQSRLRMALHDFTHVTALIISSNPSVPV